jgi:amino acid transporter
VLGAFGAETHLVMQNQLSINLPWEAWSAIALALIALMGRRQVNLNAAILGVALALEIAMVTVLDIGILTTKGLSAFSLHSFAPSTIFAAGIGAGLVFAFNSFIGFEATAIFAEEAKQPKRSVPRATYIAIILIAVFYALTSWCLVSGAGGDLVQKTIAGTPGGPGNFLFAMNAQYVGGFTNHLIQYLLVTSLFAALLATHNATARYFFALSREGLLPNALSRTHPKLKSPYVARAPRLRSAP